MKGQAIFFHMESKSLLHEVDVFPIESRSFTLWTDFLSKNSPGINDCGTLCTYSLMLLKLSSNLRTPFIRRYIRWFNTPRLINSSQIQVTVRLFRLRTRSFIWRHAVRTYLSRQISYGTDLIPSYLVLTNFFTICLMKLVTPRWNTADPLQVRNKVRHT